MKKSTYTKTALASLLTLCSFSSFAAGFSNENMKEVKKQESTITSGKMEVMKTSNKKLKEKMDRVCNADPREKAEEFKEKEELKLAAEKKKEKEKLVDEKEARVINDIKGSNLESSKAKKTKTEAKVAQDNVKVIDQHIGKKEKVSPVVSIGGVDITNTNQGKSGVKITFGGVIDAQGYGKAGPNGEDYKCYNNMISCYTNSHDQVIGLHPIFGQVENISDYSNDTGMVTDAMLHLKAENKNEDLGLLYGADVQLQVPVTEGKGASQGVNLIKGRSAHLFLNSKYGDLKLGYQFGPEALMRLDATRIATVDGAADSNWFRKVNLEGINKNFPFYVTPRLYTESFSSGSEAFSFYMTGKYHKDVMTTLPFRVAYYSPNYMGAKFGIGYSPRYGSNLFIENKRHIGPDYEHIVSAGVSYEYDFHKYNMKVKTSVVGEYGLPKQLDEGQLFYDEYIEYDDLVGVNLGISADYKINENKGIKLATSFAYLGESDQPKSIKKLIDGSYQKIEVNNSIGGNREKMEGLGAQFEGNDKKSTMYWTAGTSYQYESLYTSLTYFGSKEGNGNKLHDIALGVQYDLSSTCSKSKFVPYAVIHYFMTDDKGYKEKHTAASNQGLLFLTGIRFSF